MEKLPNLRFPYLPVINYSTACPGAQYYKRLLLLYFCYDNVLMFKTNKKKTNASCFKLQKC